MAHRQRETFTVIEAVGVFGQEIPPDHWTTAVSPNEWTDGYLCLQWLERNFEPYTRPAEGGDEYRLLIYDGHESHEFIEYAYAYRIKCLCLPAHSTHLLQPLDVVTFGQYAAE